MNDIELDDFLKKIESGLQESRKQLLNEYALRNDSLVVGDEMEMYWKFLPRKYCQNILS